MAESKYSIRLAAVNAFKATFDDFEQGSERLQASLKEQQAEIRRLNNAAKRIDGHERLQTALTATGADLDRAREKQARLTREQREAGARLEALASDYAAAAAEVRRLEASTEASAGELRAARAEHSRLGRELGRAERSHRSLTSEQDQAVASVRTLEAAQRSQRNELDRTEAALQRAGVDTGRLADEQRRLESAAERANAALKAQRGRLAAVSEAQGRIDGNRAARADMHGRVLETAALGYVATRPLSQAMTFEGAMAGVEKLVDFAPGESQAMGAEILRMANEREIAGGGLDAVGIAQIVEAAAQSNVAKDDLLPYARDAAVMATAFGMSAADAGQTMMQWQASMNLDQGQAVALADTVNYVADRTKNVTPAMVSEVLRRQGSVALTAGFSEQQATGLAAALLSGGSGPEIAATALKNATGALTKGSAATAGQADAMAQLGFDPMQLARAMQDNAPETMVRVLEALSQEPPEEVNSLISQLFGEESKGAITPLLTNLDLLRQAFADAGDTAKQQGNMQREAARQADLHGTSWEAFKNRVGRTTTLIGTALLPVMTAVLEPTGAFVDMIGDAAENFPGVTRAIGVAAGGLLALKTGALALRFAGLLVGQGFNRAGLLRAQLDARTTRSATLANAAYVRLNSALARMAGMGGPGGGGGRRGAGRRPPAPAGRAGVGSASPPRTGLGGRLAGLGDSRAMRWGGRVAMPLALTAGTIGVANAASDGDAEAVGNAAGGMVGGMGGMWAGSATGAALGTMVMPGVGTAVGGAVGGIAGGIAGSEAGAWLGEQGGEFWNWLFGDGPPDRLAAPEEVAREVVTNTDNRRVVVESGAIQVQASGNRETDEALVDSVLDKLTRRLSEGMDEPAAGGGYLGVRIGASLTDGGN